MSPHAYESLMNKILNIIFATLVESAINETEHFHINTLEQWLESTPYGILLDITSYIPVNYHEFLSRVICKILKLNVLPEKFKISKSKWDKRLKRSYLKQSIMIISSNYISSLLLDTYWTHEQLLEANTCVTINEMQRFIQVH